MTTTDTTLHRIVYVSTANDELSENELENILTVSRKNNAAKNITGLLVYSSGNILQVLEGQHETLIDLYKIIQQDHRHYGCIKIQNISVDKRIFSEWTMGYKAVSKNEFNQLEGFLDIRDNDLPLRIEDTDGAVKEILSLFLLNNR